MLFKTYKKATRIQVALFVCIQMYEEVYSLSFLG